jgi:hypothetical protein
VSASTNDKVERTTAWHYTTGRAFISIVEFGWILPATAFVPKGEKPAVWFSLNQDWEQTANKGGLEEDGTRRTLTREETCERGGGLVRFGVAVEAVPCDWNGFKKRSGIRPETARCLAARGRACGADPNEWRVSFEPVPREQWVAVDVWDRATGAWVRVAGNGGVVVQDHLPAPTLGRDAPGHEQAPGEGVPVRAAPKVGRNDPCTCGSGRKFKKCCGPGGQPMKSASAGATAEALP